MPKYKRGLNLDTEAIARWRRESAGEQFRDARLRALTDDIRSAEISVSGDNGVNTSEWEARVGRAMSSDTVIAKLRQCNPKLYFERSRGFPNLYGIYIMDQPEGRVYVNPEGQVLRLTHICGMEAGIMPEFTVVHRTEKKVANPELFGNKVPIREIDWKTVDTYSDQTRGWRTILVRLLHGGFITRADVEKHFGWIPSMASQKWAEQTA